MKQALVLAMASFGITAAAFAQVPTTQPSPGPHDPNPPQATPDLQLPPPCAPEANLAAAGPAIKPVAAPPAGLVMPVQDSDGGNTQCSALDATQRPGAAAR